MLKNKTLAITLPIIGGLVIIGSGFSSWYFGHEDLKINEKQISVYTVSDVTKGTISILSSPNKMYFSEGRGEGENLRDGIDFYTLQKDNSYLNDDKVILKYSLADENDSIEGGNFKLFISFGGTLFPAYVKLTDEYQSATETEGGYDFASEMENITDATAEDPYGYFKYTLSLRKAIEYSSVDAKPLTEEKYSNLHKALKDATINIKFVIL